MFGLVGAFGQSLNYLHLWSSSKRARISEAALHCPSLLYYEPHNTKLAEMAVSLFRAKSRKKTKTAKSWRFIRDASLPLKAEASAATH